MAKKELVPENIQKQFNKIQFQPGEIVFFTWLGTKKYGYVKATKQANWGIQYTVEANNTRYPCGIEFKGYKTAYTTGCIYTEETRSIGVDELKRRSQTGIKSTDSEIIRDTPRPKDEGGSDNRNVRRVSDSTSRKTKKPKTNDVGKDVILDSDDGMQSSNTKKRKDSKLDSAIQRQRDFLNGFVKKD